MAPEPSIRNSGGNTDEYNKVRPQSGNPNLGGGVTFSIPQFGDFFYDMVCRTRLSQFMGNLGTTPLQGTAAFPLNSAANNLYYNIVDPCGNVIVQGVAANPVATAQYRNFVRYCEYPGNRAFAFVKFDVNGNPLDQYDTMIPVFLEKFCTPPNKRVGHDRLVGQEVPLQGYSGLCCAVVHDADSANTPAGISRAVSGQSNQTVALFNEAAVGAAAASLISQSSIAALNAPGGPQIDVSRTLLQVVNGPQTPKPVAAPLEIWNKLRFWFNDDVRLSIASVSIPFGQRFISIDLAPQQQLAFEVPSIYLETIFDDGANRNITYTPIFQVLGMTEISIEKMELYINNIFVNPEINTMSLQKYTQKRVLVLLSAC